MTIQNSFSDVSYVQNLQKRGEYQVLRVADFYDQLAPEYDEMTSFQNRFAADRPVFTSLIQRYDIHSAIDAGCGTGFQSLLLSELGIDVMGIDVSEKMIEKAEHHARHMQKPVRFLRADFVDLPAFISARYDAVLCMGNTLPHAESIQEIKKNLESFKAVLHPGGRLIIQLLNYERILTERKNIQRVHEKGTKKYLRSYDYRAEKVIFNIEITDATSGQSLQTIQSIVLLPLVKDELVALLMSACFEPIELFGSIALTPYDSYTSTDLVLIAQTPQRLLSLSE